MFDDHHGPHGMSETFQHYLAGLIATAREFSLLWAPTINSYKRFQLGSWAPTGVGLGHRQPHPRVPQGRSRQGHPRRVPHPRQRREQLLRLRRHASPAGCTASRTSCALGEPFAGNGYEAPDIPRIPWNIVDAIALWERSDDRPRSASATTCTTTSSPWPRPSGRPSTTPSPTGSSAATGSASNHLGGTTRRSREVGYGGPP